MSSIPTITLYRPDYDAAHPERGGTVTINAGDTETRIHWMAQGFRDIPPGAVLSSEVWRGRCSLIWNEPGDEIAGDLLRRSYEEITSVATDDEMIANKLPLVLDAGERIRAFSPNTKDEVIQALFEILCDAHFAARGIPSKSIKHVFENAEMESKALRARCETIVDLALHRSYVRFDKGALKKPFPLAPTAPSTSQPTPANAQLGAVERTRMSDSEAMLRIGGAGIGTSKACVRRLRALSFVVNSSFMEPQRLMIAHSS